MNASLLKIFALLCLVTVSSHALFGIGGQFAPNPSAKIDKSKGLILGTDNNPNISLDQESATGLTGFGAKIWIDILPIIDVELTSNIQFTRYDAGLSLNGTPANDTTINLKVETGLPAFPEATPVFGKITTDISVLYPFLELPPIIKLVKLYFGAGISHVLSVSILDKEFAEDALKKADIDLNSSDAATKAAAAIKDALEDEGIKSGIGGHLVAGAKLKPPVIPIAIFLNGKLHIGGGLPDGVSSGFTLEMGAALAF